MAVANTLAYYDTATITAVKCFIVQALGWKLNPIIKKLKQNWSLEIKYGNSLNKT
jgi:hypothetical protein